MRAIIIAGISTLALAGCDGAGPKQAPQTATLPTPKAGLWHESIARDGHSVPLIGDLKACMDSNIRARLSALGSRGDKRMCRDQAVIHDPDGGYRFSSTCDTGPGGQVATKGLLMGDLASRYRVHTQTDTSGASLSSFNGRHSLDMEADYLGPCPAGMTPGDVILGNGMKLNMTRLQSLAQSLGGG